ncbi:NACHT and WD repeat domain-containing protein 2 isoform X2 [Harmonia axyridis]|uniref:NACHT and WD repeat domain-containing protein 2 isoform X2 n=1 Tax=Harmonia axyridis TaxID=115357 RepID=UPI001E2779A3|nr:NACHT and WD repeat domain-containing protein 2 isoform X2 [Harmonia axyridis]
MKNNDETILEILQGHKTSKWPSPKSVKIFIASTKYDFIEERRVLLEYVGPELQNYLEQHELEVELIDMHFRADEKEQYDPFLFEDHLNEIRSCHKTSRGYFFMSLIGDRYGPFLPPLTIDSDTFSSILSKAEQLGINTEEFSKWYQAENDVYSLVDFRECEDWKFISINIFNIFFQCISNLEDDKRKKYSEYMKSNLERQFNYAIGIAPGTAHSVLNIIRNWDGKNDNIESIYEKVPLEYYVEKLDEFCHRTTSLIPEENNFSFTVPWKPGGLDPEAEVHKPYLSKFKSQILNHLKQVISNNLEEHPELKSRKKIVQENFEENITHLTLCYSEIKKDFADSNDLNRVRQVIATTNSRISPIIIYGNQGSGKTSFLQTIFREIDNWSSCRIFKIVRFASTTPQSSYNLELLRLVCQQICIALKLPEGFLPKDASFDPLYVNKWFQSLLRNFEESDQALAIFIDDIHLLNTLDFDVVSGLSWLPLTLPKKVFIFCTSGLKIDDLKLTAQQKEKFRNTDSYIELPENPPISDYVLQKFCDLEKAFKQAAIRKLFLLLSCTQYGLTELELLEILMPTSNNDVINPENAEFNFSTLSSVLRKLGDLKREKVIKGKLLIDWRHNVIKELVVKHYQLSQDNLKSTHTELADFYFDEFCDKDDESEEDDAPAPLLSEMRETPFKSTLYSDVIYSRRHIEEFWIHLLKTGDTVKLKTLCMCNYDFLLAALQTFSVSYLRCILKHVRCYLLDREIELVYYAIKMSTDILTRDTYQLGTQLIAWLRPVNEKDGGIISSLVTSAMAWCDGFTLPLVVPMTDWLKPPLPDQSKVMHIQNVRLVEISPSGQHIVCVTDADPQLWHIMTSQMIHTFKGHNGTINCMAICKQSQYLLTGSEDLNIIVWDLRTLTLKQRIVEHIAPVLCITSALANTIIVSGGEDSSIIISSMSTAKVLMKIDHHRGPVKSVKTTSTGDVLLSASEDFKVCLWSLETYSLLNTITFSYPIKTIDVSADSVFLLALCKDNNLYLRTSATGTKLHTLSEHRSKVTSICLTQDSSKAVVGCVDSKLYIYNVHSGKVERTLCDSNGEVTSIRLTEKDDFLLKGGANRIVVYPFRGNDNENTKQFFKPKKKSQHLHMHTGFLTCIDVSRDGTLAASGGTDNLVNVWQLNNQELTFTLTGHTGTVSTINFAPNGTFVCSGSEDKTLKIWSLSAGNLLNTFSGHQCPVSSVYIYMDSTRVISSDKNDNIFLWNADNGNILNSYQGPNKCIKVTNTMKYNVASNGDTTLKIWATSGDEKYVVNHSKEVTCFILTMDSQFVITGSKDMSLKVWQVSGGKLSQVLMGHTAAVSCVAVSVADKTQIISGSFDNNLIVWDINTGADLHTLSAHLSYITCVKLSGDGTLAISGSDDKSIIIWDAKKGLQLTSLQLHFSVVCIEPNMDFSRIGVLLKDTKYMPIICLHNTTAKFVKLPTYASNEKNVMDNAKPSTKRQMKRLLKKEVSLDTYTWQKKYAHLTSNLVIPAVDEKFKRRFSISASMEEISKLPQNQETKKGVLTKQASLAQSQHFDQLEALWNERSPPRRRLQQSLSKQSSLAESYNSSEEDHFDNSFP